MSVHSCYVEVVTEVKSDSESGLHRDDVLAGHKRRRGARVPWTVQMSLMLVKHATTTGYSTWEQKSHFLWQEQEIQRFALK